MFLTRTRTPCREISHPHDFLSVTSYIHEFQPEVLPVILSIEHIVLRLCYNRFAVISLINASFVSSLIEYIVLRKGNPSFAICFISDAVIGVFNI